MHSLIQLLKYSGKYKLDLYLAAFYSLLNKLFDIIPEILIGVTIDVVVKQQDSILANLGIKNPIYQIIVLGIIAGLIWICKSLFQYLYRLKWCYLAQNIPNDMRLDAYNHVQQLEIEYFENNYISNLMTILNDDINQLERFLNDSVNQIIQIFISTLVIFCIFFIISSKIAILTFIPIPLILIISSYLRKILTPRYLNMKNKAKLIRHKINNNLTRMNIIKSFTAEKYEVTQLKKLSNNYQEANYNATVISAAIIPTIKIIVMISFLIALIYGGILTINGQIQIASYSILILLSKKLLCPLTNLSEVISNYQRSMTSVTHIMNLLNTPIKIKNGTHQLNSNCKGSIIFDKVTFGYKGNKKLFKELSFAIAPGETVAFVGNTDSGKKTIVHLLLRFYEITSGGIFIDYNNIKDLQNESLRSKIGLVSQNNFLIDGTIAENIGYGDLKATRDEIIQAAKIAKADKFIQDLPHGYDTIIEEKGQKLSGWQRQLIALAKAILKNPAILILDEATSNLDNHTEVIVQQALDKITKDRTTIIVTHQLSTAIKADRIYVLKSGKIVEHGTHQQLLNDNGAYADLWKLQIHKEPI